MIYAQSKTAIQPICTVFKCARCSRYSDTWIFLIYLKKKKRHNSEPPRYLPQYFGYPVKTASRSRVNEVTFETVGASRTVLERVLIGVIILAKYRMSRGAVWILTIYCILFLLEFLTIRSIEDKGHLSVLLHLILRTRAMSLSPRPLWICLVWRCCLA